MMLYNGKATNARRRRPNCDLCKTTGTACIDGKTQAGPWGYMCNGCYELCGRGLGMGVGQVLLCGDEMDAQLIKHYKLEEAS